MKMKLKIKIASSLKKITTFFSNAQMFQLIIGSFLTCVMGYIFFSVFPSSLNYIKKYLLLIMISLPLIGIFLIVVSSFSKKGTARVVYTIGLFISGANCVLAFLLWYFHNPDLIGFQFVVNLMEIPNFNHTLSIGVDGFSLYFIILTNIIICLCILSLTLKISRLGSLLSCLLILQCGIICAFVVMDLLGFYIFFETTLIPIFLIILMWGSRSRKVRAGFLISIYTLAGSIFMLYAVLFIISKVGSSNYYVITAYNFSAEEQKWLWWAFFIGFAVKLPLIPIHIWLPEAHVEAPTIGSVILAALLLKLGGYGFIRYNLALFPIGTAFFTPVVFMLGALAIVYTGVISCRQTDLKKVIAYSSVGHMALILISLVNVSEESIMAGVFQMISHGFVSAGLFFCVGIIYSRLSSRYLFYYGGLCDLMPGFSLIFFLLNLANMGFPLTSNFVGEIGLSSGVSTNTHGTIAIACLSSIFGVGSSLWTFNRLCFGPLKWNFKVKLFDVDFRERFIMWIIIFFVIFLGLNSEIIMNGLYFDSLYLTAHHVESLKILSKT